MQKLKILNSLGEPIVLNAQEQAIAAHNQKIMNAMGYQVDITTLTEVQKQVVEQKFFEIPPADFLPIRSGFGAFSTHLLTYKSYAMGGDFEKGLLNTGSNDTQMERGDVGIDSAMIKTNNWAKEIAWTFFELQHAQRSGAWDLISAKENMRKKNWDLGIQRTAFLGLKGDTTVKGFYTLSEPTVNTTLIAKPIKSMTAEEMTAFVGNVLSVFRQNANYTSWPTHFTIPESDFLGLGVPYSSEFPNVTKLQWLENMFKTMTKNQGFVVAPNAYGMAANSGLAKNRYVLHKYDVEVMRMDVNVEYTNTLANTVNGFGYQNVGYGQFTGVQALRPAEILYIDETTP